MRLYKFALIPTTPYKDLLCEIIKRRRAASMSTSIYEKPENTYSNIIMHHKDGNRTSSGVLSGYIDDGQMKSDLRSNRCFHPALPASQIHIRFIEGGEITAHFRTNTQALQHGFSKRWLHYLDKVLSAICDMPSQPVGTIDFMTPDDFDWLKKFTHPISPTRHELLHEMCLIHATINSYAPAVRSWDGDLTYQELKDLVHRLAHWLVDQGVGPGIFVACVFYKSTWAIAARLAVLMAGGAYVCVDAHDPPVYLSSVLKRTKVSVLLSSTGFAKSFCDQVDVCFEVSAASIQGLAFRAGVPCPNVTSTDPCVVFFTSGSTGTPKEIVQEHRSYASALVDYIRVMNMGPQTRMFQFDAYAFDISNNDYLAPLIAGGCCCVPTNRFQWRR